MSDWMYDLPVVVDGACRLRRDVSGGRRFCWAVLLLAKGERARVLKGVSPGMLPPLGIIFGLFVAFLAAQVWSDFDRAQEAVNREASALRAVVLLAASFPGEPEAHLRSLVRRHIEEAANQEWPAMSRHRATLTMVPAPLAEVLHSTLALTRKTTGRAQRSTDHRGRSRRPSSRPVSRSQLRWWPRTPDRSPGKSPSGPTCCCRSCRRRACGRRIPDKRPA